MATSTLAETPTLAVQLTETPADAQTRARLLENPGFGTLFGEHMVRIDYADGAWGRSVLQPVRHRSRCSRRPRCSTTRRRPSRA